MEIGIHKQKINFNYRGWSEGLILVWNRSKSIVLKLVLGLVNLFSGYKLVQQVGPNQREKAQHEFDVRVQHQNFPQL